ncbi:LacI family DNA-binding transcriptional regulator [Mesorhizobium sp. BAC0120]|uniref:LacI family DNA-binding transcriptional regulator n=1 Tax=Mesorhizobium sp. BAC0120 TaxID=3090670 RepID=UPI00298C2FB0|nr:LacI family DNA-binding transcriptional regulator [Mesorhizobium sp. BAC0120]MDW6024364.1 LacI family DNA-binding transcriptional regulator [Mesorhizobium sp. BAC0120]
MEEFARAVGLSRPTVSKFFQDPASVRPKTRARIETVLKQSGFRPNIFAVNLNRRRTKIIGLIVPDPSDPFYATLAQLIETEATAAGYLALVLSSNGRPDFEARAIETITALNVAGAIIAPLGETSQHARLKALARDVPLIFIDSPLDNEGPFVGTNNQQSIALITEYLCRSGEPPTYFDTPKTNNNQIDRRNAYIAAMERLDLEPRFADQVPSSDWNFERASFDEAARILRGGGFPTRTLLCANDRVAFGVLAAMYQAGMKVGFGQDCDFRVAGHDNQRLSAYTCPPLTTVSQNCDEMGRVALRMLFDCMDDPAERKERILLDGALVLRKSA